MGAKVFMRGLAFKEFKYSSAQFGLWRIGFGLYFLYYLITTYPYLEEIFIENGTCPALGNQLFFTEFTGFPQPLLSATLPQIKVIFLISIALSLLITIGFYRRIAAVGLGLLLIWQNN